jgi:peptidoglycan hydrolase CwlO-like protein
MAINLNLSSQTFAPASPGRGRPAVQQTPSEAAATPATSTLFVNLSDQPQSITNPLNIRETSPLDVVDNNLETSPPATNTAERQINTLEQQQSDIRGEQQELQGESDRIEQQIRALEQQERTIDQRLNRLRQSQSLGLIVDLRA